MNKKQSPPINIQDQQKQKQELFLKQYTALCRKHGLQLAFEPRWARSSEQGDYRLVIIPIVVMLH